MDGAIAGIIFAILTIGTAQLAFSGWLDALLLIYGVLALLMTVNSIMTSNYFFVVAESLAAVIFFYILIQRQIRREAKQSDDIERKLKRQKMRENILNDLVERGVITIEESA